MRVYFTNEDYYYKAMLVLNSSPKSTLNRVDAFFLLIHGISYKDLENLCIEVSNYYQISTMDAYNYLQEGNPILHNHILDIVYNLLDEKPLGTNVVDGNNTSS